MFSRLSNSTARCVFAKKKGGFFHRTAVPQAVDDGVVRHTKRWRCQYYQQCLGLTIGRETCFIHFQGKKMLKIQRCTKYMGPLDTTQEHRATAHSSVVRVVLLRAKHLEFRGVDKHLVLGHHIAAPCFSIYPQRPLRCCAKETPQNNITHQKMPQHPFARSD